MPVISVIASTYNRPDTVAELLEALSRQTFTDDDDMESTQWILLPGKIPSLKNPLYLSEIDKKYECAAKAHYRASLQYLKLLHFQNPF